MEKRIEEQEQERWKRIPEFPRYEISSLGRVKSYTNTSMPEGKLVNTYIHPSGYVMVTMTNGTERCKTNKNYPKKIHRLIAEAFIPVPDELKDIPMEKLQIDHKNTLKTDNSISNLRWCTPKGNAANPITLEKVRQNAMEKRKMVYQYDEDLNLIATYPSTLAASIELNKSQGNIVSCCTGSLRRYLGYIWSYTPLTTKEERERLENEREEQRQRNRMSSLEASKRHYRRNREKLLQLHKEYYQKHREEKAAYQRIYNELHKEERKERDRRWRELKRQEKQRQKQLKDGEQ